MEENDFQPWVLYPAKLRIQERNRIKAYLPRKISKNMPTFILAQILSRNDRVMFSSKARSYSKKKKSIGLSKQGSQTGERPGKSKNEVRGSCGGQLHSRSKRKPVLIKPVAQRTSGWVSPPVYKILTTLINPLTQRGYPIDLNVCFIELLKDVERLRNS